VSRIGDVSAEVTQLLHDWQGGDESALERLMPVVHQELKRQARSFLIKERKNHTIQPTELVNEAFLRIVDIDRMKWNDRAHFFAITATTMRRILVDHARKISANKRGGDMHRVTLSNLNVSGDDKSTELLDLDDAMNRLSEIDPRKAKVVEMRFFGGLSQKEIGEVLKVTGKTVQRDWEFAKLWLLRELSSKK